MTSRLRALTASDTSELEQVRQFFRNYAAWLGVDLSFQGFADEVANLPGACGEADGRLFFAKLESLSLASQICYGSVRCTVIRTSRCCVTTTTTPHPTASTTRI